MRTENKRRSLRTLFLRDYRNDGILPYIRMKGNILYRESDIEKVLRNNESKTR